MHSIQIRKTLFLILLTFIFSLTGLAQSSQPAMGAAEAGQLRFVSRRPVEHLRLQVHNQAGALIHDSGLVAQSQLVWPLGDGLKAGLYDWTLTVKEPGDASPRIKRGQFNLGSAVQPAAAKSSEAATVAVGGSGTVNTIPKWTTATDLGDSIILEENGMIAIGTTPSTIFKLRVFHKPDTINSNVTIHATLSPYVDPNNDRAITTGSAVAGVAENKYGSTRGVHGASYSNIGVGVWGQALHEPINGTDPDPSEGIGVLGSSLSREGIGVKGIARHLSGETIGVRGESESNTGTGVYGEASSAKLFATAVGVQGVSASQFGKGVFGVASHTFGINYGVFGRTESPNGFAGYFQGRVHVAGNLSKASGSFKIDHPLDPENKTLSHSFVESPDMMNIYNGIVTLGKDGSAEVALPDWFEALNREFRYQLTCIGGFAPVYVSEKVKGNRFKIAGGQAGMEVSWQLTGVRKDAYAEKNRIQVEEMKPVAERGTYLNPEAFGKSAEKSVERAYEKAQQQ